MRGKIYCVQLSGGGKKIHMKIKIESRIDGRWGIVNKHYWIVLAFYAKDALSVTGAYSKQKKAAWHKIARCFSRSEAEAEAEKFITNNK